MSLLWALHDHIYCLVIIPHSNIALFIMEPIWWGVAFMQNKNVAEFRTLCSPGDGLGAPTPPKEFARTAAKALKQRWKELPRALGLVLPLVACHSLHGCNACYRCKLCVRSHIVIHKHPHDLSPGTEF